MPRWRQLRSQAEGRVYSTLQYKFRTPGTYAIECANRGKPVSTPKKNGGGAAEILALRYFSAGPRQPAEKNGPDSGENTSLLPKIGRYYIERARRL